MSPPYRIGDVEVLNYIMISADQNLEVLIEAYHNERHDRSQSVRNYESMSSYTARGTHVVKPPVLKA